MKKIFAKLRRDKTKKTYIVHMVNGKKFKIRAKNYEITYFTANGGKCSTLKFINPDKSGFIVPSHVIAVLEK